MSTKPLKALAKQLAQASSYQQWRDIAAEHDERSGAAAWRLEDETPLYDYEATRKRLDSLRAYRKAGDNHGLLFALNEGVHGNMGGMGNSALYKVALTGTKQLIVDYVDEIDAALRHLASTAVDDISLHDKLDFFHRARQCYGRSALMLSGSGMLLYFHVGVVKALWEQDLLPTVMTGASGGAIVAATVASHTRDELAKIFDPQYLVMEAEREATELNKLSKLRPSQISADTVEDFFERLIPDITFQEAAQLTGIHVNVSVAPAEKHQTSRLLNDIASPNVLLREALMATCAFPGFYPAVTLAARDRNGQRKPYLPDRKWIDGSVSDDLPIKRVMRLYGVNHSIVSQTNPVVIPFLRDNAAPSSKRIVGDALRDTTKLWSLASARLLNHSLNKKSMASKLANITSAVLAQTYTGDITVLPPQRFHNLSRLLTQRTSAEIIELIQHGQSSTWPKIAAIRTQTKISNTLQTIIKDLELNLVEQAQQAVTRGQVQS